MNRDKLLKIFVAAILLWGITIRILLFLQNRDLIIDEANIARNLYERGFARLALPLSYEQYAPPVFLWIEKLFTLLFGFSEYALRIYPLLAGIASLFLFILVLKEITSIRSFWYPLALLAIGFIFIRYSTEVKQYITDVMITLSVILAALKTDVEKTPLAKFFMLWFLAGSLAIWASMPAIFVLAGIGCYYTSICIKQRNTAALKIVLGTGIAWCAQFLFYYLAILRPEANSDYLQNYHQGYFLIPIPKNGNDVLINWRLFRTLLQEASGYAYWSWIFNILLMIPGIVLLFKNNISRALLIVIPLLLTLAASALHQFSLIPRVALFIMPLMLILIGYGFDQLLQMKFKALQITLVLIAVSIITIKNFNVTSGVVKQQDKDELMKEELLFLKMNHIPGKELYIGNGSAPAFIYYTQIHPDSKNRDQFNNVFFLQWNTNYDSLAQHLPDTSAFIYTSIALPELRMHKAALDKYRVCTDKIEDTLHRGYAYIYVRK